MGYAFENHYNHGACLLESLWANRKLGEIIQQHRLSLSHSVLSYFFVTFSSIPLFVLAIIERRNTSYLRQKHRPAHFDASSGKHINVQNVLVLPIFSSFVSWLSVKYSFGNYNLEFIRTHPTCVHLYLTWFFCISILLYFLYLPIVVLDTFYNLSPDNLFI